MAIRSKRLGREERAVAERLELELVKLIVVTVGVARLLDDNTSSKVITSLGRSRDLIALWQALEL
jgi:hypothetical protein